MCYPVIRAEVAMNTIEWYSSAITKSVLESLVFLLLRSFFRSHFGQLMTLN